jgi:thymidylate kinase
MSISVNPIVVYFEGIPRSGKSTLINNLALRFPDRVTPITEYVDTDAAHKAEKTDAQTYFVENDELKYSLARSSTKKLSLVDRGHLSTVVYNLLRWFCASKTDSKNVLYWYHKRILKEQMLPDLYILLSTSPSMSFSRRTMPLSADNMWDREASLDLATTYFPRLINKYEASVPVLTLDSTSLSLAQLEESIIKALSL